MRRWLGCVVLACACGPKVDVDDASGPDESSSGEATTSTMSSSSVATSDDTASTSTSTSAGTSAGSEVTTVDPSVTVGETGCDGGECEPCGPGCVDESDCIDGKWMCNCVCDDPGECPMAPHEDFANQGKSVPVDCGSVTPLDDVEVWQALQDCVLWQVDAGGSFFADYTTGDEPSWIAVAGADGAIYATAYWELTGLGTITQHTCEEIQLNDVDCQVVQGATCLACFNPSDDQVLCDPK